MPVRERRLCLVLVTLLGAAGAVFADNPQAVHAGAPADAPVSAEQALDRLRTGNEAFRKGFIGADHLTVDRRMSLTGGQHPFAIILSCADSRVPPEQVFSQGLGDLFTVRVAGNISEPATVASIEYAAAHLGSRLLVILGHTRCGAVTAALEKADDTPAIRELVAAIRPAIETVPRDQVDEAVKANVHYVRGRILQTSALLAGLVKEGKLKVVEGVYDLDSGEVRLTEAP
jgi:carbonic anhydrase